MPLAAIYARVSSDKQRQESTIASQTAALIEFARSRGYPGAGGMGLRRRGL
jgi:site-specific DNA recombinase